ncbi:MAG: polysaccharide deacetylase family protein [Gammaproteobacteria bacterium]|nr:polysaccharide deacetylase family protein [Gammaproteobacteria bacterium]
MRQGKQAALSVARAARRSLFAASRAAGIQGVVADSEWRRNQLCILCYHGVSMSDEHEWLPELFVPPEFLRARLEVLRRNDCTVLPLGEAVTRLYAGTLPRRSVVLTFDDGFYNFYDAAAPVLKEFDVPATNYVSTYYSVNQRPLLDLSIRYVLWKCREKVLDIDVHGQAEQLALSDPDSHKRAVQLLRRQAANLEDDRDAQSDWIRGVAEQLGFDWSQFLNDRTMHLMNADEIRDMSRRGLDMQLHTHRHRTPRSKELFVAEVTENKSVLEGITGKPAVHFCYPSGDFDAMFLPWLSQAGVESATIGVSSLAREDHHALLLPRYIDTILQSDQMFENWVLGMNDRLRFRAR